MSQLDHYISQLTLNIKAPTLNNGDELMHVRAGVWALLTFPTLGGPVLLAGEAARKAWRARAPS